MDRGLLCPESRRGGPCAIMGVTEGEYLGRSGRPGEAPIGPPDEALGGGRRRRAGREGFRWPTPVGIRPA